MQGNTRLRVSKVLLRLRHMVGLTKRRYPDFFVVGATRAGTTYLHHTLASHPDIFMPRRKELQYFNRNAAYRENLSGYAEMFHGYGGEKLVGEATPLYMEQGTLFGTSGELIFGQEASAIDRIHVHFPETKLIVSLRDPFTRMVSMHEKNWRQGKVSTSLAEELQLEMEGKSRLRHIFRNRYDLHLSHIFTFFPRKAVWPMLFEEWTADTDSHMNALCGFLGVSPQEKWRSPKKEGQNEATRYGKSGERTPEGFLDVPDDLRAEVRTMLHPAKTYVEELLNKNLPWY